MTLSNLCKYYGSCIELENNTTISVSIFNNDKYIDLSWLDDSVLKGSAINAFLRNHKEKEHDLLIGYPILKIKQTLSPVFLLPISYSDGTHNKKEGFYIDKEILINKDIIDRYSVNNRIENIYELRELEEHLGFANGNFTINDSSDISNILNTLRTIRPAWEWKDMLDAQQLAIGAISQERNEGILNRAILIAKEPTPYTVGLANELVRLSEMPIESISASILYKFLTKAPLKASFSQIPIVEVLPVNQEQKKAIQAALSSDLSLIAGPPGTGKTQVVANLVINAAIQGQSVLLTSKNNNAVNVVVKRINDFDKKHPIVLRYEKNLKQCLTDYTQTWERTTPQQEENKSIYTHYAQTVDAYSRLSKEKEDIFALRNELDEAEKAVCQLRDKYQNHIGSCTMQDVIRLQNLYQHFLADHRFVNAQPRFIFTRLWHWLTIKRRQKSLVQSKIELLAEMKKYGSKPFISEHMSEYELANLHAEYTPLMTDLQCISRYNKLLHKICQSRSLEQLDELMLPKHSELQQEAQQVWRYWLSQHSRAFSDANRILLHSYLSQIEYNRIDSYDQRLNNLLPVHAITALSARKRLPFLPALYDLLIIDEASQCDIASMLPLMMRAKRMVVIGDQQQLNHICLLNKQTDRMLQVGNHIDDARWSYRNSSIYDLASSVVPAQAMTQLRDHHRSFKSIIEFSNQEFYAGSLRVATDYRKLLPPENNKGPVFGMQWMNVIGHTIRPEKGGAYNAEEADGVIRMLRHLAYDLNYEGTIGVTTPFHLQAEIITRTLEADAELRNHLELKNKILIDTVHKFQGDERDVIIFSPVVSTNAPSQSLSFLKSTGNLFNVAITRARSLLVTIGNQEYCKHCGVSYLEHFAVYGNGDEAPVEASEWEHLLQNALSAVGIPVTAQYHTDKYYLDLALFHNGRKLDIEVDGEMYHRTWTGEICYNDQIRNQTLMQQGWDVIRFWVPQVRDELPWCVEQIKRWMNRK